MTANFSYKKNDLLNFKTGKPIGSTGLILKNLTWFIKGKNVKGKWSEEFALFIMFY